MAAYLNFDMVGRVSDNKLTVQATGTSAMWPKLLEQANVAAGFDLVLQEDPYQPTDVGSFNTASVRVPDASSPARTRSTTSPATPPTRSTTRISIASANSRRAIVKRLMDAPRRAAVHEGRAEDGHAAAAPACASSPARFPTTPPT